ncbi:hypothetical protein [Citrobacter werkmanii]|uniref:hypothetical protein n=1 Tax=Citrobacter werkmanii TaxID=67827 RepID=UPI0037C6CF72
MQVLSIFDGIKVIGKANLPNALIYRVEMTRQVDEETNTPEFFIEYVSRDHIYDFTFGDLNCTNDQALAFAAFNQIVATIKANMEFAEMIMKHREEKDDC